MDAKHDAGVPLVSYPVPMYVVEPLLPTTSRMPGGTFIVT